MTRTWLLNACLLVSLLTLAVVLPCTAALELDEKSDILKLLTVRDTEDLAVSRPENSTCDPGEQKCADNVQCVSNDVICDGGTSCRDKSDEEGCESYQCLPRYHKCADNRQCIYKIDFCDGITDCNDRSDESNETCDNRTCPLGYQKCADQRQCRPTASTCDEEIICMDGSDEERCVIHGLCYQGERHCADDNQCVLSVNVCDGVADCDDGSDEIGCVQYSVHDGPLNFLDAKQACIDAGGNLAMPKNSDEQDAMVQKILSSPTIGPIYWIGVEAIGNASFRYVNNDPVTTFKPLSDLAMGNSNCLVNIVIIDAGWFDHDCNETFPFVCQRIGGKHHCSIGQHKCANQSKCIPRADVCNGRVDCHHGSDEQGCDSDSS